MICNCISTLINSQCLKSFNLEIQKQNHSVLTPEMDEGAYRG